MHGDWTPGQGDARHRRRPRQGEAASVARRRTLGFTRAHLFLAALAALR
jgi:hypothetical protein